MKAPADGVYELGAGRFRIKKGQDLPKGAIFKETHEEAAATYGLVASAGYQETVGKRSGASARFGELDGERIAEALKEAGYHVVKSEELLLETDEQTLQSGAKTQTGPSENTKGTGPSETPEAGQPVTAKSSTAKKD